MELNDNGDGGAKNVEVEEIPQTDIDIYAQQIQSKYRKIRPKKMKVEQLEVPSTYSILKTSPFKGKTVETPIFVTTQATSNPTKNTSKVEVSIICYVCYRLSPISIASFRMRRITTTKYT